MSYSFDHKNAVREVHPYAMLFHKSDTEDTFRPNTV